MLKHVAQLLAPFAADGCAPLDAPIHATAQRWGSALYPIPEQQPEELHAATDDGLLVAVGDWLAGSEVQRCVLQAHAAARRLAARLAEVQ